MVYKIKQGTKRSGWFFKFSRKNKLKGEIKFLGDISYYISFQNQPHTLIGLSDGKDSCKLAWRYLPTTKQIEILTVTVKKGKEFINHLSYAEDNEDYEFELIINKTSYVYRFGTNISLVKRLSKYSWFRKISFPRFCGKEKSPRNIYIKLEIDE